MIKESRFSFWKITIACTAGITAKNTNGKNICNQSNALRTNDSFNVIISNANDESVSVQAKAELLSEKDQMISTAQSYINTSLAPDSQDAINILLPTSNQTMSLGTNEKIKFSGIYEIDGKKVSISMTPKDYPETTYYLSGLVQTTYPNPMSPILEFSWEVGNYSHNSLIAQPGTLSPGIYKLQITDGTSSSNYILVAIK